MTTHLRLLSFYVEEPSAGQFCWVIHECVENVTVWSEIQRCDKTSDNWGDAWAAGHMFFLKMVKDRRVGPRAEGEDKNEDEDTDPAS